MITPELIVSLLLIMCVAWILGTLFTRFGLPAMLGELLAGVILGPPILGLVSPTAPLELLAELGIFFGMFHTGIEMDPKELLEHISILAGDKTDFLILIVNHHEFFKSVKVESFQVLFKGLKFCVVF